MKVLNQEFSVPFKYDVYFTNGIFQQENNVFKNTIHHNARNLPAKVFFVIDDQVAINHPNLIDQIRDYCNAFGEVLDLCGSPMVLRGGEYCKNHPAYVDQILQAVNDLAIDRQSYIVALGGGAILDMVGYASSIAHRGIRHIRIPTTVLSQNDSGIGVKNAINAFGKKNFLGCFTPPVAVINDFDFLETLDTRDWRSGIAEAIKVALIKDIDFFERIEQSFSGLNNRDMAAMEPLIFDCAKLHLEHIASGDPFELGSSRPLDFGHWAAHKLEYLSNYELRHGEAVAIGIALDVVYSELSGLLSREDRERILLLLQNLGFKIFDPFLLSQENDEYQLLKGLNEFREHLGGKLTIMLLEQIGKGIEVNEMDNQLILEAAKILKMAESTKAIV